MSGIATEVTFTDADMIVGLLDGRTICMVSSFIPCIKICFESLGVAW